MKKLFKQSKKGFTIVELVIVIGVIGILSAILIPTFVNLNSKAEEAKIKEECASAYTMYVIDSSDESSFTPLAREATALKKGDVYYVFTTDKGWAVPTASYDYTADPNADGAGYNGGYKVYSFAPAA